MSKIDITIDTRLVKKSGLTMPQYMTLAYLRHDTNAVFSHNERFILAALELKGFIRIIDEQIIVDSSTEDLFETSYTKDAKKILEHYNDLKKEHLGITRLTTATKYLTKFKGLLVLKFEVEYIKKVLTYLFKNWVNDQFWRSHLTSVDTIVRHFDKYSGQYEMDKNQLNENKNVML